MFVSLVIGTLIAVQAPQPARRPSTVEMRAAIDSFVTPRIAGDSFSGVVLFASRKGDVYRRPAGYANREREAPIATDTKLQIASVSKLFTQIAIRQLEQAGRVSISDTVGRFLPEYPNPVVRSRVTIEHLLRHRSGIGSFWNERFLANLASIRTVDDYVGLFQDDSLLFAPGTSEAYSNGGYVILGAIIERVTGRSYHDYLRTHVFEPAGMTHTVPFDSRAPATNAAVGYTRQPLGGPIPGDRRLAGSGPRPGYEQPAPQRRAESTTGSPPPNGARMRLMGPDGRELTPEQAREAMARRAASNAPRRPNTSIQPSMSGPAGDHYSTVDDLLALAHALLAHRLLDSARTTALLGARYAAGSDFRANGGGPGANAELSIFPTGEIMVVLSNYDPPAATSVAQFIRARVDAGAVPH
jgi:CubicO group peptidase (beta-lactamase class C family)